MRCSGWGPTDVSMKVGDGLEPPSVDMEYETPVFPISIWCSPSRSVEYLVPLLYADVYSVDTDMTTGTSNATTMTVARTAAVIFDVSWLYMEYSRYAMYVFI